MAAWWQPTAEGYFKHVPKAAVLQAVGEFAPESVNRLAKLKKADIAREAERLVNGKGWMPVIFKMDGVPEQGSQDGAEAVTTVAGEPAGRFAALTGAEGRAPGSNGGVCCKEKIPLPAPPPATRAWRGTSHPAPCAPG